MLQDFRVFNMNTHFLGFMEGPRNADPLLKRGIFGRINLGKLPNPIHFCKDLWNFPAMGGLPLPGTKSPSPKNIMNWWVDVPFFVLTWKRRRECSQVPGMFPRRFCGMRTCRGVPVRTVNQFCAYLRAKDPRIQVPRLQVSAETPV